MSQLIFKADPALPRNVRIATVSIDSSDFPDKDEPSLFLILDKTQPFTPAKDEVRLSDIWASSTEDFCLAFVPRFPKDNLQEFGRELEHDIMTAKRRSRNERIPLISWINQGLVEEMAEGFHLFLAKWEKTTAILDSFLGSDVLEVPFQFGGRVFRISSGATVDLNGIELEFSNSRLGLLDEIAEEIVSSLNLPHPGKHLLKTDLALESNSAKKHKPRMVGYIRSNLEVFDLDLLPISIPYYKSKDKTTDAELFEFRVFEGIKADISVALHPTDWWRTYVDLGQIISLPTYFRTTNNSRVYLTPGLESRLILNKVFVPKTQAHQSLSNSKIGETEYRFLPAGTFRIAGSKEGGRDYTQFVCGLTGTEFFSVYAPYERLDEDSPRQHSSRCKVEFVESFTSTFIQTATIGEYKLTESEYKTVQLRIDNTSEPIIESGDNPYNRSGYFVQPEDSALFDSTSELKVQSGKTDLLTYKPLCLRKETKEAYPTVPIVPFAGLKVGRKSKPLAEEDREHLKNSKLLCGKIMAKHRIDLLRPEHKTKFGLSTTGKLSGLIGIEESDSGVTPQGWLAEVSKGDTNSFKSIYFCKSSAGKVAIDCTTPAKFDEVWLDKEVFLVIDNMAELKYKKNTALAGMPTIDLEGWRLALSTAAKYVIIKSSSRSILDLLDKPDSWTQVEDLTSGNKSEIVEYLKKLHKPIQPRNSEQASLYKDLLNAFESSSWNGVLVVQPEIELHSQADNSLGQLKTLLAEQTPSKYFDQNKSYAVLGLSTSKVTSARGKVDVADTSIFAVIDFKKTQVLPSPADTAACFGLSSLSARFSDGRLEQFKAVGQLKLLQLFDRGLSHGDESVATIIGRYKKVNGKGIYSFSTEEQVEAAFDHKTVIQSIGVNRIEFKSQSDKNSFDFSGWIKFADENVFFNTSGISFSGVSLNLKSLSNEEFLPLSFDASNLSFDLHLSTLQPSFFKSFPLKYKTALVFNKNKPYSELGFLSFGGTALRYGLVFELDMGTIGALVSSDPIKVDVILGWGSEEIPGVDPGLGAGIRFPSWSGGNKEIGIEGVIKLSIANFEVVYKDPLYAIQFSDCSLSMFGENLVKASILVLAPNEKEKPAWLVRAETSEKFEFAAGQRVKVWLLDGDAPADTKVKQLVKALNVHKQIATGSCADVSELSPISYCPERNWIAGATVSIDKLFKIDAVFVDGFGYGGQLKLGDYFGPVKSLLGDNGLNIAYTKISRSVGAYTTDFQPTNLLPDLGPFCIKVPNLGITAYTNGGFKFDVGFPKGKNFSRSFQLSLGLLGGRGGFYVGYQHTPLGDNQVAIGVGFNVFYGKGIDLGIISGRFEIGAYGVIEAVLSAGALKEFDGLVGIYGFVEGHVSLGFVSGRARLAINAYAQIHYKGGSGYLRIEASLDGELSITIGVGDCATTYTYDFTVNFNYTWTLGSGSRALLAKNNRKEIVAAQFRGLDPTFIGGPVVELVLYFAPHLTVRGRFTDDWDTSSVKGSGIGTAAILYSGPNEDALELAQKPTEVVQRLAAWALYSITHTSDDTDISLREVEALIEQLNAAAEADGASISYQTLDQVLGNNFIFNLSKEVPLNTEVPLNKEEERRENYNLIQFPLPADVVARPKRDPFRYSSPWVSKHFTKGVFTRLKETRRQQIYGDVASFDSLTEKSDGSSLPFAPAEAIVSAYFSSIILGALTLFKSTLDNLVRNQSTQNPAMKCSDLLKLITIDPVNSQAKKKKDPPALTILKVAGRNLMNGTYIITDDGTREGLYSALGLEVEVDLPPAKAPYKLLPFIFEDSSKETHQHKWFKHPPRDKPFFLNTKFFPIEKEDLADPAIRKRVFPKRNFDLAKEVPFSKEHKNRAFCYVKELKAVSRLDVNLGLPIFKGNFDGSSQKRLCSLPSRILSHTTPPSGGNEREPDIGVSTEKAAFVIAIPLKCSVEENTESTVLRLPTIPEKYKRSLELGRKKFRELKVEIFENINNELKLLPLDWKIFRNNLSTITNPPDSSASNSDGTLEICSKISEQEFLNILLELSQINDSGYFLTCTDNPFGNTEGKNHKELYLVATLPKPTNDNSGKDKAGKSFRGANAIVLSSEPKIVDLIINGDVDHQQKVPAGELPVVCLRQKPETDEYLKSIYCHVGYEIIDSFESPFRPLVFPLSMSPQKIDDNLTNSAEGTTQMFAALLPLAGQLKNPVVSKYLKQLVPPKDATDEERATWFDPYSTIGRKITIGLRVLDVFGNEIEYDQANPITTVSVDLLYTDRIIEFSEWPGLTCVYKLGGNSKPISIKFRVALPADIDADQKAELVRKYQNILWQIEPRTHKPEASLQMYVHYSMNGKPTRNASLEKNLPSFVQEVLEGILSKDGFPAKGIELEQTISIDATPNPDSEIQQLRLSIDLTRPSKYVDTEVDKLLTGVQSCTNLVLLVTEEEYKLKEPKDKAKADQPSDREKALAETIADTYRGENEGFTLAYSRSESGDKLYWCIRNRLLNIKRVDLTEDFFAQLPLGNKGFTGQVGSEFLNNFDIDSELDFVLDKYENLIASSSIGSLLKNQETTDKISKLVRLKNSFAEQLSDRTSYLIEPDPEDLRDPEKLNQQKEKAKEIYKQALLKDLRNSYKSDCIAQIPYRFAEPYDQAQIDKLGNTVLYGHLISKTGNNIDATATKLPLAESQAAKPTITFVSTSNRSIPDDQRAWNMQGTFAISHIERDLAPAALTTLRTMNGDPTIESPHWLYLVTPHQVELGSLDIPISHRSIPPAPVIAGDFARTKERKKIRTINDASTWDYEMQVEVSIPTLDKLATIATLGRTESQNDSSAKGITGLISDLRQFRKNWTSKNWDANPEIDKIIALLISIREDLKRLKPQSLGISSEPQNEHGVTVIESSQLNSQPNIMLVERTESKGKYAVSIAPRAVNEAPSSHDIESKPAELGAGDRSGVGSAQKLKANERRRYLISYKNLPITVVNKVNFRASVTRNEDLIRLPQKRGQVFPTWRQTMPGFIMQSEEVHSGHDVEPCIEVEKVIYFDQLSQGGTHSIKAHLERIFEEIFREVSTFGIQISWYHGYEQQPIRKRINDDKPVADSDFDIEEYELTHRVPVQATLKRAVRSESERSEFIDQLSEALKASWSNQNDLKSTGFFQMKMTVYREVEKTSSPGPDDDKDESNTELLVLNKLRLPFDSIDFSI